MQFPLKSRNVEHALAYFSYPTLSQNDYMKSYSSYSLSQLYHHNTTTIIFSTHTLNIPHTSSLLVSSL